jgi:SSS family solute:Na+ symporter
MKPVFLGVLGYVVVQLAIGLWVSRRIRTEDDYLLAGRSLGYVRAVFTIFATWFGAETCVGAAGQAYENGVAGTTADPFGYAGCILLMAGVFAVPLYRRGITTIADLFAERFGRTAERIAVLLLVPTSLLWAAAQIRAFGQVLGATSGWELDVTLTLATAVVLIYTSAGGFAADVWTDLVQGAALILGLAVLAVAAVTSGDAMALESLPAASLSFASPDESVWDVVEKWAVPILGSVIAQELIARILAARSAVVARRSAFLAGAAYLAVGLVPLGIGLIASQTLPGLADPEHVLVAYAERHLGTFWLVIFAGALVSAILSTVDSCLLVAGSLVAHNVVLPAMPRLDERQKIRMNRVAVFLLGLVAYVLALRAEGVYALVEGASALGSAGVFVCVVFGLFTGLGGAASACSALLVGALVYVGASVGFEAAHPYTLSLAASLVAYLALARRRS